MLQKEKHYGKREAILHCLQRTTAHPSAETVYQMLCRERSDISRATVYRNLAAFRKDGVICSVGTVGGVERFDFNTAPHAHFICRRCQAVIDLPDVAVPEQMKCEVGQAVGAHVEQCVLSFGGLCQTCCDAQQ